MRTYDNNLRRDYTGVSVNKILLIRFMITRPSVRQKGKLLIDRPLSSLCMQINCAWFCQGISINLALDIAVEETLFTAISYDELLGRDSN